ncbi:hypothetical protein [Dyadobacter frigoris]|uniref:CARDB domain-containing protein n=1 Tax=Dyadobacter frigoris TaxID=2576211 RepID=A0A4U6DA01_9BACT|nr:hypothetical protein [Dyadobacter frigoris]TKT93515.1 hypothetical protein FDK13_06635 [Dyadobacter frigoris]GLU55753.1 hypothetical protein Dfri01_52140 [Dyadobacter frigoris]
MALELEIRDGSPWYLSPDVWVVSDPADVTESMPVAGTPCYLMAKVRNNGRDAATNATVRFYWANPSIGVTRNTATLIGQAFVSLAANDLQDVLCLTAWVPEFLNEGHECILAEAFHSTDPLPLSTDFNVSTDRHVAQRNLSVLLAMNGMFHLNFEMHNSLRKEQHFTALINQVPVEKVMHHFPMLVEKYKLKGRKEGKLVKAAFTDTKCADADFKEHSGNKDSFKLGPFGKQKMAITGKIEGDFAFVQITQRAEKNETGGLGFLIINQ